MAGLRQKPNSSWAQVTMTGNIWISNKRDMMGVARARHLAALPYRAGIREPAEWVLGFIGRLLCGAWVCFCALSSSLSLGWGRGRCLCPKVRMGRWDSFAVQTRSTC